ncbi:MAG: (d)CMP kinase [Candidatus Zixiibacteriota bacterium]
MFVVAIDGPAGSGKSTTAKRVAAELCFRHLDTGAMYRALTCLAIQKQIDSANSAALVELARASRISFASGDSGAQRVLIAGADVSEAIRTPEVSAGVSQVAAHSAVREALVERQRELAISETGVVMEGRDIGTVVFPEADVKVFLVASLEERAKRRVKDFAANGVKTNVQEQVDLIMRRDASDSEREASPLIKADDAIEVDTTRMSIDEQVSHIVRLSRERMTERGA